MTKKISLFLLLAIFLSHAPMTVEGHHEEYRNRKIIVWRENVAESVRSEVLNRHRALRHRDLSLVNGSVVSLSDRLNEQELKNNPNILRVEEDVEVFALYHRVSQPNETLPWGIDRIDAELVWPTNVGNGVKVAVIDTGISRDHADLRNNLKGGVNTIHSNKSWDDDNGHGSHVAGIIAASDNTIGVIGAAHSVNLYSVKALNSRGSGYISDIIEGIQWSIANGMQVVNLSLATTSDVQSFHDAIIAARNAGITVVAAAGNNGGAVNYPAAYPEAIAVGATDINNNLASFSSRGPEMDLVAPGVDIYSTFDGTGYRTLSGTSMAAPHVAGAAALVLNSSVSTYDSNGNGRWDPAEVQRKLQDKATATSSGYRLVNAYQAVQ